MGTRFISMHLEFVPNDDGKAHWLAARVDPRALDGSACDFDSETVDPALWTRLLEQSMRDGHIDEEDIAPNDVHSLLDAGAVREGRVEVSESATHYDWRAWLDDDDELLRTRIAVAAFRAAAPYARRGRLVAVEVCPAYSDVAFHVRETLDAGRIVIESRDDDEAMDLLVAAP
jgi:hypothetical protein